METCYYGHEHENDWIDWTDKLDEQTTIRFPAVVKYDDADEFIDREERRLDPLICERIRRFCGEKDTLLYSFWICVLQIMLYKYDRKSRATLISPQIGHSETNTFIALSQQMYDHKTVAQCLSEAKDDLLESQISGSFPYKARNPLFSGVMLICGKIHSIVPEEYPDDLHRNLLMFYINMEDDAWPLTLSFNTTFFTRQDVRLLLDRFCFLFPQILKSPHTEIGDILLEPRQQTEDFWTQVNQKRADAGQHEEVTIDTLFERQVQANGDAVALVHHLAVPDPAKLRECGTYTAQQLTEWLTIRFLPAADLVLDDAAAAGRLFHISTAEKLFCLRTHKRRFLVDETVISLFEALEKNIPLLTFFHQLKQKRTRAVFMKLPLSFFQEQTISGEDIGLSSFPMNTVPLFYKLICILYSSGVLRIPRSVQAKRIAKTIWSNLSVRGVTAPKNLDKLSGQQGRSAILLLGDTTGTATMGLLYLASYLYRHGYRAFCHLNSTMDTREELRQGIRKMIEEIQPDFVGISLKWFPHIARALEMCRIVKSMRPDIQVIVGGNTASHYYKDLIEYPDIDYIVRGDGEKPLLDILSGVPDPENVLTSKKPDTEITYVNTQHNGKNYLSDLDTIIYPDNNLYLNDSLYIYCGSGCNETCIYCAGSKDTYLADFKRSGAFFRDPDMVREDIKQLKKYTRKLMFDFAIPAEPQETYRFYQSVFNNIDLSSYLCCFYFWYIPDEKFIRLLAETFHHVQIHIDIPSLSESYRFTYTINNPWKQYSNQDIVKAVSQCDKYENLEVYVDTVAGLPNYQDQHYQEGEQLIVLLNKVGGNFRGVTWERLHAQPGAMIAEYSDRFNMHSEATTFTDYLEFSRRNLETEKYPQIENLYYPCVVPYASEKQSIISRYFLSLNEKMMAAKEAEGMMQQEQTLTYRELEEESNRLSRYINALSLPKDSKIAILVPKSNLFIIALLGVLKAGYPFIPLSVDYPAARVSNILEQSKAVLLTTEPFCDRFGSFHTIDIYAPAIVSDDLPGNMAKNETAYIIFTSGTTGNPKGVMIGHDGIVNLNQVFRNDLGVEPDERILWFADPAFDASIWDIFMALFTGSRLYIMPTDIQFNKSQFLSYIRQNGITTLTAPPSFIKALPLESIETLKRVISAGSQMTSSIAQKWRDSTVPLYNAYGPTEVSICATIKKVIPEGPVRSIGRPLKHVGVYIMDGNYRKQPSMVRGQICITGTGVMQGYLGNHTLTSGCIQSPDENDARERLYATGDIGFALPNGEIVCLGREDQQVKFHGYRIELQEVEQCFCSLPTVKNAVAFIDNQILVCIYTADTQLSDDEIYQYLCKRLPAYMIPGIFQYEMDLPMLVNGKPDRIKIKQCYQQNNKTRNSRQDEITKAIIDCWSKLFQQKNIDQNSNFFELGGDSLLIMQFIEAMDSQYPGSLKVADVFRLPIVSRLAAFIDDQR